VRQRPGTSKGVVFMTLEDETDIANIIVWPKVFEKNRRTVMTARFLAVRGRPQRVGLVIHVVAASFVDLSAALPKLRDGDLSLPAVACPSRQEGLSHQEDSSRQEDSWRMLKSHDFH
jgi:error-prone DNA polymerase